jgi:type I restriction enzyme S subunit
LEKDDLVSRRNENRPGYKNTPIGWMPADWEYSQVGLCCLVKNELRLPLNTEVRKTVQGLYPYYGPTGILDYIDHYRVEGKYALIAEDGDHFLKYSDKPMTLLVSGKFNVNNHAHLIEGTARCSTEWFYRYFLHRNICSFTTRQGAGRYKLNKDALMSLPIALPPVPVQNKITQTLSVWDNAIEQTRKLIEAKKRRKKALMQQLLSGKKRLHGFEKSQKMKLQRFFSLPVDWKCPHLRDIAEETSERNKNGDSLTVLSCSKHIGFVESSEYFGKQVFSSDTSNYKVIRRGEFGYPSNHVEEGSIGLLLTHDLGLVSPIYTVFRCKDVVVPEYLFAVFKTETYRHIFSKSTNASVDRRGSLRWHQFSSIRVPLPPIEEQRAIVEIIQAADGEISCERKQLAALEKQKRGLMQKLLTGEVRVKV